MSKGNLENVLGGTFIALPGMDSNVKPDPNLTPQIPGVDLQTRVFEKTFDASIHETMKKHSSKYNPLAGRFDPFSVDKMKLSVGTWSVLIDRAVVTFQDAADHAMALCSLWAQEDQELQVISQQREASSSKKEATSKTQVLVEGTKAYEIEQARLNWKDSVRKRNEAISQWNAIVESNRIAYKKLRDS